MPEASECVECEFLRRKHTDAILAHIELRAELREASRGGKRQHVTALLLSEAAALQERDCAEAALRRHQSTAHGSGGDADAAA